ncbi:alcohol dehydrogenase [Penicillium malachiteum]|nr:alcohol dehydrogenase [Penicillium malachiteum]
MPQVLNDQSGIDSIKLIHDNPLPEIGDPDILVKLSAASLNYCNIVIPKGTIPLPFFRPGAVPGSDGAGVVEKVDTEVHEFRRSSLYPSDPSHACIQANTRHGLGQEVDGTLRHYEAFHETALVHMPETLDFLQASTLTCSGLTAWDALFGVEGYKPQRGDWVLVQGTGGVPIAGLQVSSSLHSSDSQIANFKIVWLLQLELRSDEKANKLKSLGAHHVINYRKDPNWGETAKKLTTEGEGVHMVVDVGGFSTVTQSLKAVRIGEVLVLTGVLGKLEDGVSAPSIVDCQMRVCTARTFFLGMRDQFREMNRFIDAHDIEPVIDDRVFEFEEVKAAYELLERQQHLSKTQS